MRPLILTLLATVALVSCTPPPADEFFAVDTTDDSIDIQPGDGLCADAAGRCSLRAAVIEGNSNPNTTQIDLVPGAVYVLTLSGADEDAALTGDLDLTERTYVRTPVGGPAATIDANSLDRVFDVRSGQFHFFEGLILTGGNVTDDGGGGIRMLEGLVGVEDTRITGNQVALDGAGIWAGTSGTLWLEDSTVDDNVAGFGIGGGIVSGTDVRLETNVTVHGNVVNVLYDAQIQMHGGELTINQSTITSETGQALAFLWDATATVQNSIVSGAQEDCLLLFSPVDAVTSSHVVWSDATCEPAPTDVVTPLSHLLPLADNGGPVPTRLPASGSPAIDLIDPANANCSQFPYDARQSPRPSGAACDAGAIEL